MIAHTCHWPDCPRKVEPMLWGCKPHWMRLPFRLRSMIWSAYRPGQERTKAVSREYLRVARLAQRWIRRYGRQ